MKALIKREFFLVLPFAAVFLFLVLLGQNRVAIETDFRFAEFITKPLYFNARGAGIIADNLSLQPWMFIWIIALAFVQQYEGFNDKFAASWPVKPVGVLACKLIFAMLAMLPGLIASGLSMSAIRADNIDYIMDSIAFHPPEIYDILAKSASVSVIFWQVLLCFVALSAIYVLYTLINLSVRYKVAAVVLTACCLFYLQLLFEMISSMLYTAGYNVAGRALLDFLGMFDFANLPSNMLSQLNISPISSELTAIFGIDESSFLTNSLPTAYIYRFDWAAMKTILVSIIMSLMLYLCVRAYSSKAALTRQQLFLFPAARRIAITSAIVWVSVFFVYTAHSRFAYWPYQLYNFAELELGAQNTESELYKQTFAETLIDQANASISSKKPNVLRINTYSLEELTRTADLAEGLGMDGFREFISGNITDPAVYLDDEHDIFIFYQPQSEESIYVLEIYMNNLNKVPDSNLPRVERLREHGYYLSDIQLNGQYDVEEYSNRGFIEDILYNHGWERDIESSPVKAMLYLRDGEVQKIKMTFAYPPGRDPVLDTDMLEEFTNAAGVTEYTYDTQTRYMTQNYYEWNFIEVNIKITSY